MAGLSIGPVLMPTYEPGTLSIHNTTITGNTGVGIAAGGILNIPVDLASSIVTGNLGANGDPDFYALAVNVSHSAIGSASGITNYHDLGGNLPVGTNLDLQPLAFSGGPTPTRALLASSPAINAGSNPDGQLYDQRGVGYAREGPPGFPDIGAFERQPGVPVAVAATPNVFSGINPTYQFTVTYSDDTAVLYSSIAANANAVIVTPPAGIPAVAAAFVSATPANNAATITATYQFAFPAGLAAGADDGRWTVTTAADQVQNTNGVFVQPLPVGAFNVAVPRTLTVTSPNDAGPGTLRAALLTADADAPAADSIAFSNSAAGGATNFYDGAVHTISLLSALPNILGPITITGPGSGLLTVTRGAGSIRIFDVSAGAQAVNLSGMTVSYGNTGTSPGGGIRNVDAVLTLTDVSVANNTASAAGGGGIYMSGPGVLNIVNSSIINNRTTAGYNGPPGSAIDSAGGGTINVTNSTLSNNGAGFGGAVFANGPTTISNSRLTGNASYYGGAFEVVGNSSNLTITDSTVGNNSARYGGGGYVAGAT